MNKRRIISKISLLSAILTVTWVILMAISSSQIDADWKSADYVKWASSPDAFFVANYINVTLLTFLVVLLFGYLFVFLQEKNKSLSIIALLFVPIYGIINIVCYSMQISLVPDISEKALSNPETMDIAVQLIQMKSNSIIGFLNGMAYAILGIPSIIFGQLLFKSGARFSGLFLLLNGISCMIGIIGYLAASSILEFGTVLGGMLFLTSLITLSVEIRDLKIAN